MAAEKPSKQHTIDLEGSSIDADNHRAFLEEMKSLFPAHHALIEKLNMPISKENLTNVFEESRAFSLGHKNSSRIYEYFGYLFMISRNLQKSFEAYSYACFANPENFIAHLSRAAIYIKFNQPREGKQALQIIIDSPNADKRIKSRAYYNLGMIHSDALAYDDALAAWKQARELDPTHQDAINNLEALQQYLSASRKRPASSDGDVNPSKKAKAFVGDSPAALPKHDTVTTTIPTAPRSLETLFGKQPPSSTDFHHTDTRAP